MELGMFSVRHLFSVEPQTPSWVDINWGTIDSHTELLQQSMPVITEFQVVRVDVNEKEDDHRSQTEPQFVHSVIALRAKPETDGWIQLNWGILLA